MSLNENPAERKASISSAAPLQDLCALDFMTQDSVGSILNIKCEFGTGTVALFQCCGRLDRRTYPRLSMALANAIKQEYCTFIIDFSYCSYDAGVLTDIFDRAVSMGITVVTVAMISKLAEYWKCSLPCAFNEIIAVSAIRNDNVPIRKPRKDATSNPAPGANHAVA